MVEDIIIKRGNEEFVLKENRIAELTSKYIESCSNDVDLDDDFAKKTKVIDMLIDMKKAWFPATLKNLNVNVSTFDNQLSLWMKAREELKKEKPSIFEIK